MDLQEAIKKFTGSRPELFVDGKIDRNGMVFRLVGPLDMGCSQAVQDLLVWAIDSGEARTGLVVDLQGVNYVSSTGVGALTFALVAAKRNNVRFRLAGIQDQVRSIFVLLGFMAFFEEVHCDD